MSRESPPALRSDRLLDVQEVAQPPSDRMHRSSPADCRCRLQLTTLTPWANPCKGADGCVGYSGADSDLTDAATIMSLLKNRPVLPSVGDPLRLSPTRNQTRRGHRSWMTHLPLSRPKAVDAAI